LFFHITIEVHEDLSDRRLLSPIELLLKRLVSGYATYTLAFDEPRIKPAVCLKLVSELLALGEDVMFLDFDLQFSSVLQNVEASRYDLIRSTGLLHVLQPSDEILEFVESLAEYKLHSGGVLVLDSLNSLQNLLTGERIGEGSKEANQKTALIVTVLQGISRTFKKSLFIINVTKQRPKQTIQDNTALWEKTLVGGRIIRFKSDRVISLRREPHRPGIISATFEDPGEQDRNDLPKKYDFEVSEI
jgi:hypothetical protein